MDSVFVGIFAVLAFDRLISWRAGAGKDSTVPLDVAMENAMLFVIDEQSVAPPIDQGEFTVDVALLFVFGFDRIWGMDVVHGCLCRGTAAVPALDSPSQPSAFIGAHRFYFLFDVFQLQFRHECFESRSFR
jgi:hypothetical protein